MTTSEKENGGVVLLIIIVAIIACYYSYKSGYTDGQETQKNTTADNIGDVCRSSLEGQMNQFCDITTSNYIDSNTPEICTNYISDHRTEICEEMVSDVKKSAKDRQQEYQDCIDLNTQANGYIDPNESTFCRLMYLN